MLRPEDVHLRGRYLRLNVPGCELSFPLNFKMFFFLIIKVGTVRFNNTQKKKPRRLG